MSDAGAILITGCSSGIGRATARHLVRGVLGEHGFDALLRTQITAPG